MVPKKKTSKKKPLRKKFTSIQYNGIQFDSELHARWAVFLDAHCLVTRWEYQNEATISPTHHNPTFTVQLPSRIVFVEILTEIPNLSRTQFLMNFALNAIEEELVIIIGDFEPLSDSNPGDVPTIFYTSDGSMEPLEYSLIFPDPIEAFVHAGKFTFDKSTEAELPRGSLKEFADVIRKQAQNNQ
tara:strand:- start:13278 stop:13832 length:555 start_codon:yes stop_codon:yes gene_type:complete